VTGWPLVLTLGPQSARLGRKVGSYFGLIPSEHSSGGRQQLGHISKQGSFVSALLAVEAGQSAARYDAELAVFIAAGVRKHRGLAKVSGGAQLPPGCI